MAKPLKLQLIEKARELIADEENWCRGYLAIDRNGFLTDPSSSEARKRCALGALIAAAHQFTSNTRWANELACNALRPVYGSNTVVLANDHKGHAAVLALFDEALANM